MKTLLLILFMFALLAIPASAQGSGVCQDGNGNFGNWEWVYVCIPGHGSIGFWVCATSGSCPGDAWCPGNNGCGGGFMSFSNIQKQGLEIQIARLYKRKYVAEIKQEGE